VATSGTYSVDFNIVDIIGEAWERVGGNVTTGNEYLSARRSIDLLFRDMENRGAALFRIEQYSQAVTSGTQSYYLPVEVLDIANALVRITSGSTNTDIELTPFSRGDYLAQPSKTTTGRPASYYVDKQRAGNAKVYLWPTGQTGETATLLYWAVIRHQDAGALSNTLDVRSNYVPALVSGLAYFLGMKRAEFPLERLAALKAQYEQDYKLAFDSDRQWTRTRIVPDLRHG
jgi:hypothetical protein